MARQHANGAVFKGGIKLASKIRAGFHGEVWRGLAARPVGGMVEALQDMTEPAGFKFSTDKFERGMPGALPAGFCTRRGAREPKRCSRPAKTTGGSTTWESHE
jgi:hypothetical protein